MVHTLGSYINQVSVDGQSVFDYLKSHEVNTYTDRNHGGSYTVKAVARPESPEPTTEPERTTFGQADVERMIHEAVTFALEAHVAKRTRSGDFKPAEESQEATFLNGASVSILKNPALHTSDQKTPSAVKPATQPPAQDGDAAKKNTVTYINEAVRKTLGVKPALTLKDLIRVSPIYAECLVAYVRQIQSGYEVVDWKGSATPVSEPVDVKPTNRADTPVNLQTNFSIVKATGPSSQTGATIVPAVYGLSPDGTYSVAQGTI